MYENGALVYCGRAGTGIGEAEARDILSRAKALAADTPPFKDPPKIRKDESVTWLRPELVAEVKFAEWTEDNLLRQASFKGLRTDKNPREIVREAADMEDDMPLADADNAPREAAQETGAEGARALTAAMPREAAIPGAGEQAPGADNTPREGAAQNNGAAASGAAARAGEKLVVEGVELPPGQGYSGPVTGTWALLRRPADAFVRGRRILNIVRARRDLSACLQHPGAEAAARRPCPSQTAGRRNFISTHAETCLRGADEHLEFALGAAWKHSSSRT